MAQIYEKYSFVVLFPPFFCFFATSTGKCAQNAVTTVSTATELTDAIADNASNIQLTDDIQLGSYLDIDGGTTTTTTTTKSKL